MASCEMRLFVRRSGGEKWIWFAGEWHRQEAGDRIVLMRVSPFHSVTCSVTASGPIATPGGTALVLLSGLLSQGYGLGPRWTLQ